MAIIGKKPNPPGLDLAYAHSSAVGKVRAQEVYNLIDSAQFQNSDPSDTTSLTQAKALRSIVDRLERLGERYHENKNVAPADRLRMEKEFEVLKEKLQVLTTQENQAPVFLEGLKELGLNQWSREIASKLAHAIFKGDISSKDQTSSLGTPVDPEIDPLSIRLQGRLRLHEESAHKPFDTAKYLLDRKTSPLQKDPPYPTGEWVQATVESVRHFVLENATTAPRIHGHLGTQDPILKVSV